MNWLKRKLPLVFDREHAPRSMEIPIFPLNTVLFPGELLPLKIFEPRYMDMAKSCLKDAMPFGICLIQQGAEVGSPAIPYAVGTLAHIVGWDMPQLGILHITAHGCERFVIEDSTVKRNGLVTANVRLIEPETAQAVPSAYAACADIMRHIVEELGEARFAMPLRLDDASWLSYRLAETLPLKSRVKQNLLEMNDSLMRLKILWEFLKRQRLVDPD